MYLRISGDVNLNMQQILVLVAEYKRNKYRNTSTQTRDAHCVMSHFIAEAQNGFKLWTGPTPSGVRWNTKENTSEPNWIFNITRQFWLIVGIYDNVLVVFWKKTFQGGCQIVVTTSFYLLHMLPGWIVFMEVCTLDTSINGHTYIYTIYICLL